MGSIVSREFTGPAVSVRPEAHLACHHGSSRRDREHCREAMRQGGWTPPWADGDYWIAVSTLVQLGVTY